VTPCYHLFVVFAQGDKADAVFYLRKGKVKPTVEAAESGPAGLALLRETSVDPVMTDLTMPELTGLDVAQFVNAMHPRLPVVLVTGRAHTISPEQRERTWVDAILAKPCGTAAMQAVIGPLIRDLADAACSGSPKRVGFTKVRGRPTSATVPGTLREVPVPVGRDAPSHGQHMTGRTDTDISTEGIQPASMRLTL